MDKVVDQWQLDALKRQIDALERELQRRTEDTQREIRRLDGELRGLDSRSWREASNHSLVHSLLFLALVYASFIATLIALAQHAH